MRTNKVQNEKNPYSRFFRFLPPNPDFFKNTASILLRCTMFFFFIALPKILQLLINYVSHCTVSLPATSLVYCCFYKHLVQVKIFQIFHSRFLELVTRNKNRRSYHLIKSSDKLFSPDQCSTN